jgi:hypothetical protein
MTDERADSLTAPTRPPPTESAWFTEEPVQSEAQGRLRLWVGLSVLGVGLIVVLVSSLFLASRWNADQRTVHALRDPGVHQVRLDARDYQIYSAGSVPSRCFAVNGASGPVPVETHSYQISPYDPADVILQTGTYFPTAGFTLTSGGVYAVTDRCLAADRKIFVAETQRAALRHVGAGLGGEAAGLCLLIAALLVLRDRVTRRRSSGWITVVAATAGTGPLP